MAVKIPLKALCNGSGDTCALSEFQSADFLGVDNGGTGLITQGICEYTRPGCFDSSCGTTFLGVGAGKATLEAAKYNTMIGYCAGAGITTSCDVTLLGHKAGMAITTAALGATLVGQSAGVALTTGTAATYIGYEAGAANSTGILNTFLGYQAGNVATASCNTAVGSSTLVNLTTGIDNTTVGANTGRLLVSTNNNTFIGSNAGCVATCANNTMIGAFAGRSQTTGCQNTFIGVCAGHDSQGAQGNVVVGFVAGQKLTGGTNNIFIGQGAGQCTNNGSNNIYIGEAAGCTQTTKSSFFEVRNAGLTLMNGCFTTGDLSIPNGRVGIGTNDPTAALSVQYNPATTNGFELIDSRDPDCRVLFTAACGELGFYTSTIGSFSAANLALSVDTSQRVGIGTASPTHTLDVNGSAQIERNGAAPLLRFTDTSSSSRWIGIPDGSSRFAIYGTNGSTEEFVLSGGNVGIGTVSPGEKLEIQGTGNQTILISRTDANTVAGLTINSANDSNYIYNNSAKDLVLSANNGTDQFKLCSDGNLLYAGNGTAGKIENKRDGGGFIQLVRDDSSGATDESLGIIDFISTDTSTGSCGIMARIKGAYDSNGDSAKLQFYTGFSTGSGSPTLTERMTILNCGYVGIGTTAPTAPFQVSPTAHAAGVPAVWLHSADNAADHDGVVISAVNNGADAEVLHVRTNNTTYANGTSLMLVRGDGDFSVDGCTLYVDADVDRVGIGTTTPSHKFNVFGSLNNGIKVVANTDTDFAPDSGYANDALIIQNSTAGDNNPVSMYFATGSNGEVRLSAIDDASNGDANFALTMRRAGGNRCYVQFWEAGTGNVGIGTTSPTRLLSLHCGSPAGVFMSFTNSSTGGLGTDGGQIGIDSNNDLQIGQLESGKLIEFYNNGGLAMVIDSSQYVGIGTNAPSEALSVVGDAVFDGPTQTISSAGAGRVGAAINLDSNYSFENGYTPDGTVSGSDYLGAVYFNTADTSGTGAGVGAAIRSMVLDPYGRYSLDFHTSGNTVSEGDDALRMRINHLGNVGIGTNTPSVKLHLEGSSTGSALRLGETNSGADTYVGFLDTSGNFGVDVNGGGYFRIATGSAERLRIDSSGNVGIGTTSPVSFSNQTSLTVNGTSVGRVDVKASGSGGGAMFGTSSALTMQANSGVAVNLDSAAGQPITFQVGSSEMARIASGGQVAINSTAVNGLLNVAAGNSTVDGTTTNSGRDISYVMINSTAGAAGLRAEHTGGNPYDGDMVVFNQFYNGSNYTWKERLRVLSSGGITFNGDTATANALDDYEEGTWTPVLSFNTTAPSSVSYGTRSAGYTKIGDVVFITLDITVNSYSGGSGSFILTGLPFDTDTANGRGTASGRAVYGVTYTSSISWEFVVNQIFAGHTNTDLQKSDFSTSGFRIIVSGFYRAS